MLVGLYRFIIFKLKFRKFKLNKETGNITNLYDYILENVLYENLSIMGREIVIKQKKLIQIIQKMCFL